MKAIVFDRFGPPLEVLELRDVPIPEVGPGEALVRMVAASVNPGDLAYLQDLYPKKPTFPQIAGLQGAGVVCAVGPDVALRPGTFVGFYHADTWAEYAVIPAAWLIPVPSSYPVERAAQFMNVVTAWDLVAAAGVGPDQWVALTAGNSNVATMTLQFAKEAGVNVIAIVRRAQPGLDLRALGAADVIEVADGSEDLAARIADLTDGAGLNAVIDCVGGPLAGDLIRTMAFGGNMVIYGGYSPDPIGVHSFDILLRQAVIKTYAYRYFFTSPPATDATLLQHIADVSRAPGFQTPQGTVHPLEDFAAALTASVERPEEGKRFFGIATLEEALATAGSAPVTAG
ncbi:zinc containing alcohol dehydrogenase superfamily protein [Baekduia alba]|uniref:quinone oxidoreductase family protein n=1 Tax=Baekduia alba TaxID=2997333 RepID=UPI0023406B8B|nr:zinc-binding dehydrogenase [Baekduia alba]WCB96346.1 zinc containing alcohol dehydrogenase superfamily protein [Baekduia alba]